MANRKSNKQVKAMMESLGVLHSGYYCQCDWVECGNWFEIGEEGQVCPDCLVGYLTPQDIN